MVVVAGENVATPRLPLELASGKRAERGRADILDRPSGSRDLATIFE
jgi:hypothetical protein